MQQYLIDSEGIVFRDKKDGRYKWMDATGRGVVDGTSFMTKVNGYTSNRLTPKDRKLLIELICNDQTNMIVKDHTKYDSEKYKKLEELKVKIKDM